MPAAIIQLQNTSIQVKDNLFRLNDVHAASGLPLSKKPSEWLRTKQAKAQIEHLESQGGNSRLGNSVLESVHGGEFRGTYASEALVYSYAMWLSPAFHFKVIDGFRNYHDEKARRKVAEAELAAVRQNNKQDWWSLKDSLERKYGYAVAEKRGGMEQNLLYQAAFGKNANQIVAARVDESEQFNVAAKDLMTVRELRFVGALERHTCSLIDLGFDFDTQKEKIREFADKNRAEFLGGDDEQI